MDSIKNYEFGLDGVNLVTDPLKLKNSEGTQFQNAELLDDASVGGSTALKTRAGLAALNSVALSGSVVGLFGWPLKTTYTRTLYAARGTASASTFRTSLDGTTWTNTSALSAPASIAKYTTENDERDARRMASFRTFVLYPGNDYTQTTDNPILVLWDGTTATIVVTALFGPSSNGNVPYTITDTLVAGGKIYFAVHDAGGTAPNLVGRVLALDLDSGVVKQVATAFGGGTGEIAGGAPSALAFYQQQLWVGLNTGNTTNGIGKIVRCYPEVDTTWTADVSNLTQSVSSLCVFKGKLYAGTQSSASAAEKIYARSQTAGTWSAVFTGVGAGANAFVGSLYVYGDALYGVQYHETAPTIHITRSEDGTSWSTDRDVDNDDSGIAGNTPGQFATLNSKLYLVFRATTATATDGFILERAGGSWTKVDTENFSGPLAVLVQRSA